MVEIQPPPQIWTRLERELNLAQYRTPWYRRTAFWRAWSAAVTAALVLAVALPLMRSQPELRPLNEIARLADTAGSAVVVAMLSPDQRTLELRARRTVQASSMQSYELWLIPVEGGSPISLAVLGSLDARFALPPAQVGRLRAGAKLAVSVEPAGGSPTGAPTGPVLWAGEIKT